MAPPILPARRALAVLALSTTLLASCAPIETTPTPPPPAGGGGAPWTGTPVPIATGDLSTYSTSYTATSGGVTYTGWPAQVLHHLFSVVPGHATTYATHNAVGHGLSADLWTEGAGYGSNNSGMASMSISFPQRSVETSETCCS